MCLALGVIHAVSVGMLFVVMVYGQEPGKSNVERLSRSPIFDRQFQNAAWPVEPVRTIRAEDQARPQIAVAWNSASIEAQEHLKQNRFADAVQSGKQALQLAKRFTPLDSRLADTYELLGDIYRRWKRCGDARANYAHAIAIWRRQSDPDSHHFFNSVANLIVVYCECDDYAAAERAFRTYEAEIQHYRSGLMDDAKVLTLRAMLAFHKNNYASAETLFRQAIQLMKAAPDSSPIEIAIGRSSLAVVLDMEGRHLESLEEARAAIASFEVTSPRHPAFVTSLNNAACSLAELGRIDESERMFQRTLAAAVALYGDDNHVVAKIMLNYASVLRTNGQSLTAADWQKRGSAALRRSLTRDTAAIDAEELRSLK